MTVFNPVRDEAQLNLFRGLCMTHYKRINICALCKVFQKQFQYKAVHSGMRILWAHAFKIFFFLGNKGDEKLVI